MLEDWSSWVPPAPTNRRNSVGLNACLSRSSSRVESRCFRQIIVQCSAIQVEGCGDGIRPEHGCDDCKPQGGGGLARLIARLDGGSYDVRLVSVEPRCPTLP